MFGDSPWDYMSDEEKATRLKERARRDKQANAEKKRRRLRLLQSYRRVELEAELRRRDKLENNK